MKEIKIKYYFENQVDEKEIINDIFDDIDNMYIWDHIYELNLDWWDFKVLDRCFFTWFLDKNWTEIFEWDILKIKYTTHETLIKVEFKNWSFVWVKTKNNCSCEDLIWKYTLDEFEIIWNIYKNKNLIDKF